MELDQPQSTQTARSGVLKVVVFVVLAAATAAAVVLSTTGSGESRSGNSVSDVHDSDALPRDGSTPTARLTGTAPKSNGKSDAAQGGRTRSRQDTVKYGARSVLASQLEAYGITEDVAVDRPGSSYTAAVMNAPPSVADQTDEFLDRDITAFPSTTSGGDVGRKRGEPSTKPTSTASAGPSPAPVMHPISERLRCLRRFGQAAVMLRNAALWRDPTGGNEVIYFVALSDVQRPTVRPTKPNAGNNKKSSGPASMGSERVTVGAPLEGPARYIDVAAHSAESLAVFQSFVRSCGWHRGMAGHFEAMFTQSDKLRPLPLEVWDASPGLRRNVSIACRRDQVARKWRRRVKSSSSSPAAAPAKSAVDIRRSNDTRGQPQAQPGDSSEGVKAEVYEWVPTPSVQTVYRRQWRHHMYHSVMMPYGLFQLHMVLSDTLTAVLESERMFPFDAVLGDDPPTTAKPTSPQHAKSATSNATGAEDPALVGKIKKEGRSDSGGLQQRSFFSPREKERAVEAAIHAALHRRRVPTSTSTAKDEASVMKQRLVRRNVARAAEGRAFDAVVHQSLVVHDEFTRRPNVRAPLAIAWSRALLGMLPDEEVYGGQDYMRGKPRPATKFAPIVTSRKLDGSRGGFKAAVGEPKGEPYVASPEYIACADYVTYGGYGHYVVSDTHTDTHPTTPETRRAVRRFSERLQYAMAEAHGDDPRAAADDAAAFVAAELQSTNPRSLSAPALPTAAPTPLSPPPSTSAPNVGNVSGLTASPTTSTKAVSSAAVVGKPMALRMDEVFVANRPLCVDTAGDPRIRGIRPAAFADISDIVRRVFFPEMPAPLALPSTAWRGVSPAEQHRRLRRAKLFVVSEGAGAVRQLVARPNTTWVIVYDHWFSTNAHFWRHPAYHIHVARSLGVRLVFFTIWRHRYPLAFDGSNMTARLEAVLRAPFAPGVTFIGAHDGGDGAGNGRQDTAIERQTRAGLAAWRDEAMKAGLRLTHNTWCCSTPENCG